PYAAAQDREIRAAAESLRRGMPVTFTIPSRHLVAAARLALKQWAMAGSVEAELPPLIDAVLAAVEACAPQGLRAVTDNLAVPAATKAARFKAFVSIDLALPIPAITPEEQ